MPKIDPNRWALYVGDFVDREIEDFVKDLLVKYCENQNKHWVRNIEKKKQCVFLPRQCGVFSKEQAKERKEKDHQDHKCKMRLPTQTKIQGVYQRSLAVKLPNQAFLSSVETGGYYQLADQMGQTELAEKLRKNRPKVKVSPQALLAEPQSFEGFLIERSLLALRRGKEVDQFFYLMVQELLTGCDDRSAKRVARTLVMAANLSGDKDKRKWWQKWTQVYLLHAWVEGLCLRLMADLQKK